MTTPNAPEGVEPWSADDLVRIRALYPAEAGGPWSAEHRWLATVDALRAERDAALEAVSASETGRADARRERDAARAERGALKGLLALLRDWAAKSPWDAAIAFALRPTPTQEPPSVCPAGDATAQASSPGGGSPSLAPAPSPAPGLRDALVKVVAHTAHTPAAPRELLAGLLASCARIAKAALSAPAPAAPSAVVSSDADVVEVVRLIGVAIGQPDRWIDSAPATVAFAVEQIRGLRFATLAAPAHAGEPVVGYILRDRNGVYLHSSTPNLSTAEAAAAEANTGLFAGLSERRPFTVIPLYASPLSPEARAFYEAAREWRRNDDRFNNSPKDANYELGRKIRRLRNLMGTAYAALLASEAGAKGGA